MGQVAEYQVFINYRVVDTQNTLASPIYDRLTRDGLSVFLYGKEHCTKNTRLSAIQGASLHVTIFSEHYAESRRCLDELRLIFKSKHTILPVFSNVEPADLRETEWGVYAETFRKHEADKDARGKVEGWKKDLREATGISGAIFKRNESDQASILEKIVNDVLRLVKGERLRSETYQVFINHRGPDAKLTHASLIYHRLTECGLRVFLDAKELRGGSILLDSIRGAISSASVHIVIFSRRYAESSWCLDELCWIFEASRKRPTSIIPIFFDVEPKDLCNIKYDPNSNEGRPYAKSFLHHKLKGRVETAWEESLRKAADISGEVVKTNGSDYGVYVEKVVSGVLKKVSEGEPLKVATHPVGLREAANDFQNKIGDLKAPKIVGIAGMCGIGKSALAKHLYNVRRSDFERSCFLFNVRGRDLASLQKQLSSDLLGHDLNINNTMQIKRLLQSRLQGQTGLEALIVLDDVDDTEKIQSLLDMDEVGPRTVIFLTSRDKDLLRRSSPNTVLYDVKPLDTHHARQLFCHHAFFGSPKPVQRFKYLVRESLKICDGLPSSLEFLGRHLAGSDDQTYWKLQLEMFGRRLPDGIINTLKGSYEALSKEKKEMFVDIGCFLVGEETELAVRVLEGLGYSDVRECLESLRQKCLVEYKYDVESNNYRNYEYEHRRVMMHNQVKGLATHIAREEFFEFAKHKPLRLSCSRDIEEMFQLQAGSESCLTRGIRIPKGQNPPQPTNDITIRGVLILVVEDPMGLSSYAISGNLVWLRLNNFPSLAIPSTISLDRLRVLELHHPGDHFQQLFRTFDKLPGKLHKLKRGTSGAASGSASRRCKPFDVEYYLNMCRNIFRAQQRRMAKFSRFPQLFPNHFRSLKNLRYLHLFGCTNLTELPNSFFESLHLQYLSLQYCINLSIPSHILGEISTLEYVDFKGCAKLVHLPEGMANQRSLKYLNLEFCFELKTLTNLSNLEHLKFLNINACVKLETLNLKGLRSLEKLNLEFCFELNTLTDLSNLEQLKFLHINGCVKLETLNLESLKSLEYLNVEFCSELKTLTNLSNLEHLKFLNINGCVQLETLNIEGLRSLEQIKADACWKLKSIEASGQQKRLNCLQISTPTGVIWWLKLETLNLGVPRSLEQIKAEARWEMKSIEELGQQEQLKFLQISTHSDGIWNDAFQFFTSTSYMSTPISSGKAIDHMDQAMKRFLGNPDDITVLDVPATTTVESPVWVDDVKSQNAIVMCFITSSLNAGFRVRFEATDSPNAYQVYDTLRASGSGGRMLHIFMCKRNTKLPEDQKYDRVAVYHSKDGRRNELDAEDVDKGWIVTTTYTEVVQVWSRVVNVARGPVPLKKGRRPVQGGLKRKIPWLGKWGRLNCPAKKRGRLSVNLQ